MGHTNNYFSLPSSSKAFFVRNAFDAFALLSGLAISYMAFINDHPGLLCVIAVVVTGLFFIVFRRAYLNRSVTFSDTGITLRRRIQKNMISKHYNWKQVRLIRYVNRDTKVERRLGRIEIHLKNSEVIELDLDDYYSYDFLNYKGKYDPVIVSELTDICNRNGNKFQLR